MILSTDSDAWITSLTLVSGCAMIMIIIILYSFLLKIIIAVTSRGKVDSS